MTGLNVSPEDKHTLLSVDKEGWKSTLPQFEEWLNKLDKYADHPLPTEIRDQLAELDAEPDIDTMLQKRYEKFRRVGVFRTINQENNEGV